MQGSIVPSSQQLLTAIERPRCSRCQAQMMLERVSAGPIGFERRLFECPRCDHVETCLIASDPNAAGWLARELRAPNWGINSGATHARYTKPRSATHGLRFANEVEGVWAERMDQDFERLFVQDSAAHHRKCADWGLISVSCRAPTTANQGTTRISRESGRPAEREALSWSAMKEKWYADGTLTHFGCWSTDPPIAVGSATSHSQQPQMINSLAALAIFGLGSSCRCLARLCSSGGGERNRRLG